jgi:tetratricopeptide (TPR) repeat protein
VRFSRERVLVVVCLALAATLGGVAACRDASVADEQPHLLSGWLYWETGQFAGGFDNPPLGQLWVTLPLRLLHREYRFPDDNGVLIPCRVPVLLGALGLALLVWRWGRALGGPLAGLVALGAVAFEPNLLAHGHVATLDAPVTAAWWAALWCWRGLAGATDVAQERRWIAGFAAAVAVATLIKFTGVLLVPSLALVAILAGGRMTRRRSLQALAAAVAATALFACVVYAGAPQLLLDAVRGKLLHRDEVRFAYLAGRRSEHGFVLYYVAALLLKTSPVLLALAAWGAVAARRSRRLDRALLAVPALVIVGAFTLLRVNVGVRHVLPVLPALALFAGLGAEDLWRRGRPARLAVAVLLALGLVDWGRSVPQFFAYFTPFVGGPPAGHRWLLDSNLAWGQDDGRIAEFVANAKARGETWLVDPDPTSPRVGRLAVESNALHNLQRRSDRPYEWLRDLRPRGFAGWSWRLYELDRASFERAAHERPRDTGAQVAYAEILHAADDEEGAQAVLDRAAVGDLAGVAGRVARSALTAGEWRRAEPWLRRGLAQAPADPELTALAEWGGLQAAVAAAQDSATEGAALVALGVWHGERHELETALPNLQRGLELRPRDPEARRAYGVGLAQAGRFTEAVHILDQPDFRTSYADEIALCRKLAATAAAVTSHAALDVADGVELGRAQFEGGRYDAAAGTFVAVLERQPANRDALAYLGEMQVRCKMRITDQALEPRAIHPLRR